MPSRTVDDSHPFVLARLIHLQNEAMPWSDKDLAGIWRHQLDCLLEMDLPQGELAALAEGRTFRILLHHPKPSIRLLTAVKDFAKCARNDDGAGLPKEIATVLYYASVFAALMRRRTRITQQEDASLLDAAKWAADRPWLDEVSRSLFLEFIAGGRNSVPSEP